MYRHLFFVLCFFAIASCQDRTVSDLVSIDLLDGLKNKQVMRLSEIVDDVEYIKLETHDNCLLGTFNPIVTPTHIICNQFLPTKDILVFDRHGKFLNHIGTEGKGPGEYIWKDFIAVNPLRHEIIIADNSLGHISRYSLDGKLINEISIGQLFGENLAGMCFDKSGNIQILLERPMKEVTRFALIRTLDFRLNVIGESMFISTKVENGVSFGWPSFYTVNGTVHLREYWRDTIYQLKSNGLEPKYRVFFSDLTQPTPYINRKDGALFNQLILQYEIKDYLFFLIRCPEQKPNDDLFVIYRKETRELFQPVSESCCKTPRGYTPIFLNDVDGFLPAMAPTQDGFIVLAYDAIYLKQCLSDGCPTKTIVKYPSKQQELIDLINITNDNDNPIIQIFHLK